MKILNLKERRWNKENILLSDILKDNRDNLDSYILTKYLNLRLKLQEHFNWLIWAISYFYYSNLFTDGRSSHFNSDEFGLPQVESLDWINGFEWKGLFIRIQTNDQSKNLFDEMKAFNYLFFDYIQLMDTYKFKNEEDNKNNYLSNEIIFPLISYSRICSLILVGSVCINKYNYDTNDNLEKMSLFKQSERESNHKHIMGNYFTFNNQTENKNYNNPFVRYIPKVSENLRNYNTDTNIPKMNKEKTSNRQIKNDFNSEMKYSVPINTPIVTDRSNQDISHIMNENNSFHSVNISHNINKDINLNLYSTDDLKESFLLSKIESKNLIKVIDDLNDNNYNNYATETFHNQNTLPKFKFMIISALNIIPNLVYYENKFSSLFVEESEISPLWLNSIDNMISKLSEKFNLEKIDLNNKNNFNKILERILSSSNETQKLISYDGTLNKMRFKIFYSDKNDKAEKNLRINDYFVNPPTNKIKTNFSEKKILKDFTFGNNQNIKNRITDDTNLEIRGKTFVLYGLSSSIKLKYSLIKNNKNVKLDEIYSDFAYKTNYLKMIDNFAKILDSNLGISDVNTMKEYFHRYGVNNSLEIFLLPKLKNPKISDLIKLDILCKMIKNLLNFHEGLNFILKINFINLNNSSNILKSINENENILNDGNFNFIKEKSLFQIYKIKIYQMIISVLNTVKANAEFIKFFYDNMNFIFFFKMLKWKIIDENLGFNLFSDEEDKMTNSNFSHENLFKDLIETAIKRPFLFMNTIEHHLNITIDPLIKFKASISLEQFLNNFSESSINQPEPKVISYIKSRELSYFLFTKCIHTSRTSTKYDSFKNKFPMSNRNNERNQSERRTNQPSNNINQMSSKDTKPSNNNTNTLNQAQILTKTNLVLPPNSMKTKVSIINHNNIENNYKNLDQSIKVVKDFSIGKLSNNIKVNSNNITKINQINNRYVDHSRDKNAQISFESKKLDSDSRINNIQYDEVIQPAKIWDNLSIEMDLNFPPILYKQIFKFDDKPQKKTNFDKYLKSKYTFNKIDTIKDWKSSVEMLMSDIITLDSSESIIIQTYLVLFINAFYVENEFQICKEILYKIKEIMKNLIFFRFEQIQLVNFVEGLITEKRNYIECEEFFSKSLIFSLFLYGDPRGRGNFGNNSMMFPLWKIARQTCILENHLTNESFKEMFHCQDYFSKILIEVSGNGSFNLENNTLNYTNNLYQSNLNYDNNKSRKLTKKKTFKINDNKSNNSDANDEDINEGISLNGEDKENNLEFSEKNFEHLGKFKYFPFPSISDVKTSYQSYFNTQNFIQFIMKNMINFNHNNILYDEDNLNKIGLNCYSLLSNLDVGNRNNIPTGGSFKSGTSRKDKAAIFSNYMYDYLLDKMCFKKNPPNFSLLAWGNNSHNETTHNNYDFLTLPRVCYKLKDEEVIEVKSGWEHNVIVTRNKRVFTWGKNESGQCGIRKVDLILNPTMIESLENVKEVACGNEHSLALIENGDVCSWGKAEDGVLGYIENDIEYIPKKIKELKNVIQISCGSIHNMALCQDGSVYSWGCSKGGQLGHSESFLLSIKDFPGYIINPLLISSLNHTKISKVSCGEAHSLALSHDGKVYGWGFTSNGQLGLGICEDSFEPGQGMMRCRILTPTFIDTNNTKIIDLQCGKTFSIFITEKNELLGCGINDLNQLGIDKLTNFDHVYIQDDYYTSSCCDVVFPTLVECFLNMKVKKVACGESHCLALVEDLTSNIVSLWSWGSNRFGQLGQGNQIKKSLPKPINYLLGYTNSQVIDISCGAFHSLCVISNETSGNIQPEEEMKFLIKTFSRKWIKY